MKVYAQWDALLAKYNIVVDETESPYPRPTTPVGLHLVFNIIQELDSLTVKLVEGGGFLMQYGKTQVRSSQRTPRLCTHTHSNTHTQRERDR